MNRVVIIGGAVTKFGKHLDRNMKSLAAEAVNGALADAGITKEAIQGAWVANSAWGILQGQESVRGQVVLRPLGIGGIPVVNVENACASSATALHGAWAMVALGEIDVALVLGMEKMYFEDRDRVLKAFIAAMDVEIIPQLMEAFAKMEQKIREEQQKSGQVDKPRTSSRSIFMDAYAVAARRHMEKYGTTQRQLAVIASKNHCHASLNPLAQYQTRLTVEEVLSAPEVVWPFTRPMCAPIGDGAAAAIVCSEAFANKIGATSRAIVAACILGSGEDPKEGQESSTRKLAKKAYEKAGIGPEDIDLAEVHDATAFGELRATEELGFCPIGEGGPFAEAGNTSLGGRIPVNVSGGLESQGHPVGATGIRQVVELYWHLTGRAGKRQVENAKVGLAHNQGGMVGGSEAAESIVILTR